MRTLLNCVDCVVTWVTWVRELHGQIFRWVTWVKYFLRGSTFYVGLNFCVGCMVKYIFAWIKLFCVGPTFLHGPFFFCVGQLLFPRRDYFTLLQLIIETIFSRVPSRQILSKPSLTSLVLAPKGDLGPLQRFRWSSLWHYLKSGYPLNNVLNVAGSGIHPWILKIYCS